jgi:hypothetical protein
LLLPYAVGKGGKSRKARGSILYLIGLSGSGKTAMFYQARVALNVFNIGPILLLWLFCSSRVCFECPIPRRKADFWRQFLLLLSLLLICC